MDSLTNELGPRVELFAAPRAQIFAGWMVGVMLIIGGLGMTSCGLRQIPDVRGVGSPDDKEKAIKRLIGGLIAGGALGLCGFFGIRLARSMNGTGVELCEKGLRWWPPSAKLPAVLWSNVKRFEERYIHDHVPARLGGLLLSETYRQYAVICHDERYMILDPETIAGVGRLAKRLRAIATAHSIPWVVVGTPK